MEMTLKQRLESVINKLQDDADNDQDEAQKQPRLVRHNLMGRSDGNKNAIKILKAEFPDILEDKPAIPLGDEPVGPFHYIDSNKILFRDHYGRYYFWCESFLVAHGPYADNVEACQVLREYNEELNKGVVMNKKGRRGRNV